MKINLKITNAQSKTEVRAEGKKQHGQAGQMTGPHRSNGPREKMLAGIQTTGYSRYNQRAAKCIHEPLPRKTEKTKQKLNRKD